MAQDPITAVANAVTSITTEVGKLQDQKNTPDMKQAAQALEVIKFKATLTLAIIKADQEPTEENIAAVQALLGV